MKSHKSIYYSNFFFLLSSTSKRMREELKTEGFALYLMLFLRVSLSLLRFLNNGKHLQNQLEIDLVFFSKISIVGGKIIQFFTVIHRRNSQKL